VTVSNTVLVLLPLLSVSESFVKNLIENNVMCALHLKSSSKMLDLLDGHLQSAPVQLLPCERRCHCPSSQLLPQGQLVHTISIQCPHHLIRLLYSEGCSWKSCCKSSKASCRSAVISVCRGWWISRPWVSCSNANVPALTVIVLHFGIFTDQTDLEVKLADDKGIWQ
jgi:hypothetical protein